MKTCPHCQQTKPLSDFYKQGHSYTSWCKDCSRAWSHEQAENGYFRGRYVPRPEPKPGPKPKRTGKKTGKPKGRPKGQSIQTELERAASRLYENAKKRSARNHKPFLVARADVTELVRSFCANRYHSFEPRNPFLPSLDRIDHRKPYEPGNIQILWLIENFAKNTFTDEQVVEFCKRKLNLL